MKIIFRSGIIVEGEVSELIEILEKFEGGESGSDKAYASLPSKVKTFEEPAPKPSEDEPEPPPKYSKPKTMLLSTKQLPKRKGIYANKHMQKYMDACPFENGTQEFLSYYARGQYHIRKGQIPKPDGNRQLKSREKKPFPRKNGAPSVEERGYINKFKPEKEQEGAFIPREKPKKDICDFCYSEIPEDPIKNKTGEIFCSELCKKNHAKGESFGSVQRQYENDL